MPVTETTEALSMLHEAIEALERRDYDAAYRFLDDDCVYLSPLGEVRGRTAIQAADAAVLDALDPVERTLGGVVVDKDHLVFWGTFGGTVIATKKSFTLEACNVWTLRDGRIVEMRFYADLSAALPAYSA